MRSKTKPPGTIVHNKKLLIRSAHSDAFDIETLHENQASDERINKQIQITKATVIAQEKERIEIGKELNENVSQMLATAKLYLETAMSTDDLDKGLVNKGHKLLTECIDELRRITKSLAPPSFSELSLEETIDEMLNSLRTSVDDVRLELVNFEEDSLANDLKISIYRIIQEQVSNILKYANPSRVVISVNHEKNSLKLVISDDGKGFDTRQPRKGAGIANMINRAQLFKGDVLISSTPGTGCCVTVHFKL